MVRTESGKVRGLTSAYPFATLPGSALADDSAEHSQESLTPTINKSLSDDAQMTLDRRQISVDAGPDNGMYALPLGGNFSQSLKTGCLDFYPVEVPSEEWLPKPAAAIGSRRPRYFSR